MNHHVRIAQAYAAALENERTGNAPEPGSVARYRHFLLAATSTGRRSTAGALLYFTPKGRMALEAKAVKLWLDITGY